MGSPVAQILLEQIAAYAENPDHWIDKCASEAIPMQFTLETLDRMYNDGKMTKEEFADYVIELVHIFEL